MNKLILTGLLGLSLAGIAQAFPRGRPDIQRIARNDGDSNSPFTVTVSSHLWTAVGSTSTTATAAGVSRLRRRAMTIQTLGTVTYSVCLSTTSAASNICDDSRAGYELGAAWGSVSIYDEAIWYARTRAGGTTVIKGVEHFESRDESAAR